MKTKQRRFKVGNYWALPKGKEIKVVGYEEGREYNVATFTKDDINQIRGVMGTNVVAEKKAHEEQQIALSSLRDQALAIYNGIDKEFRSLRTRTPGMAYLPSLGD